MSNTKKKATVHVHCTCMHLIIISELSEVNLFGLGIQKVLLELLFCFVFFFYFQAAPDRKVQQNTNLSPADCLAASVAAEQRRLFSHGDNIIIIIIIFII